MECHLPLMCIIDNTHHFVTESHQLSDEFGSTYIYLGVSGVMFDHGTGHDIVSNKCSELPSARHGYVVR